MADTQRSTASLQTALADNTAGAITPQNLRDVVVSVLGGYASIVVADGVTPQVVGTTAAKLTGFAANGAASGATPAFGSNQITIGVSADYDVAFAASCAGDAATYTFRLAVNGTVVASVPCAAKEKIGTTGDPISVSFDATLTLNQNDIVTVYVAADASGKSLTLVHGQLRVKRVG